MARVHDTANEADQAGVLEELRAEMAAMRAELRDLTARNAALATQVVQAPHAAGTPAEHRTNRRGMLRLAGAAAVGAAATAVGHAGQAAAADGDTLFGGRVNEVTRTTVVRIGTAANSLGLPGELIGTNLSAVLLLETNVDSSAALAAIGSRYGVVAAGNDDAFVSYNSNYTFHSAASRTAAIRLSAIQSGPGDVPKTPPPTRTDLHLAGELEVDSNGDLWWCVTSGSPGTWRKLAGPTTAGAFHAISPARVYDSRLADGSLGGGASRIVSIKDGRDGAGAITAVDVVPVGATAIAYNLTVADTVGGGFLAVAEGTSAGTSASSINWSETGQLLANGLQVKIDDERRVRVFTGGAGATNFIIDVVGYYR